ncbi:MAG: AAA family ATPase [Deltaproteobacteria bacterium]|nr:MAG: AAA family ATPase [Deltaproteobacteria bacterium]
MGRDVLRKAIQDIGEGLLEAMLNNIYIGISVIDKEGIVVFRNKQIEGVSGISNDFAINQHYSVVSPKGELLEVLRTGIPKFGRNYKTVTGDTTIVNRIPLILDNSIVGAMSIGFHEDALISQKYDLLEQKLEYYEKELRNLRSARYDLFNIVGKSDKILHLKNLILKCGETDSSVLITGDTGTGKELCAHAVHLNSKRRNGPFIKINCASIPRDLFESELFGYEPGAFTNASRKGKVGKFELANHGTIFLDEISTLPLEMQPKLLRVLQDGEIERIGGNQVIRLDLRVLSATNRDLDVLVQEGKFREDLYYRIKVFSLDLPPLVERKEDIPLLCDHFIRSMNEEGNVKVLGLNKEAMAVLLKWHWPGNIRELKNVVVTAANLSETGMVEIKDLPDYLISNLRVTKNRPESTRSVNYFKESRKRFEKEVLESTLTQSNWNKSSAARQLGISRPQLYALIKKHTLKRAKAVSGQKTA